MIKKEMSDPTEPEPQQEVVQGAAQEVQEPPEEPPKPQEPEKEPEPPKRGRGRPRKDPNEPPKPRKKATPKPEVTFAEEEFIYEEEDDIEEEVQALARMIMEHEREQRANAMSKYDDRLLGFV